MFDTLNSTINSPIQWFDISFAEGDDLSLLTFHDVLEDIDSMKVTTEGGHRTLINGE